VNANLSANKMRELFEYEMMLSSEGIQMFRTLASMIVTVGYFNAKRKSPQQSLSASWEKTVIGWFDILRIFTELYEVPSRLFHLSTLVTRLCLIRLSEKLRFKDLIKEETIITMKILWMKRCH
jgi:hypothetical protein